MSLTPHRYRSTDEDSARWRGFEFRDGDIVISTRSKSGTTWMQMICALLVFQRPEPPAPLGELSPWLDWLVTPREEVYAALDAQRHRRFIKTHTPLDGVPLQEGVTYLVVARDPLDMAVSLHHQAHHNIDREQWRRLIGAAESDAPSPKAMPVREWLLEWIRADVDPREELDSLPGTMWHLADAWRRREQDGTDVVLVHYDDLSADLEGQMRHLASRLDIEVDDEAWPDLVRAASFTEMRARAAQVLPDRRGVLKDPAAFFRRGTSGAGRELLTPEELAEYRARLADLGPPDLLDWLDRR